MKLQMHKENKIYLTFSIAHKFILTKYCDFRIYTCFADFQINLLISLSIRCNLFQILVSFSSIRDNNKRITIRRILAFLNINILQYLFEVDEILLN